MKYSKMLVIPFLMLIVLCFQPQQSSNGQGTKETIKKAVDSVKVQAMQLAADSINYVADSLAEGNLKVVSRLEDGASDLPSMARELKNNVNKLIQKQPDTIAKVEIRTKYVPGPVDKNEYWRQQREYSDSIAQAKKDSIKWERRGLLRKIFGTGKKYMK